MAQKTSTFDYYRRNFGKDAMASVVVFLVALPLCMGISIASGVPPTAGLITGIVGGIVVGFLAGSPLQVSGPAAGLTVLVWQIVQHHGLPMLGVIVLLAGLIVFALAQSVKRGLTNLSGGIVAADSAVVGSAELTTARDAPATSSREGGPRCSVPCSPSSSGCR